MWDIGDPQTVAVKLLRKVVWIRFSFHVFSSLTYSTDLLTYCRLARGGGVVRELRDSVTRLLIPNFFTMLTHLGFRMTCLSIFEYGFDFAEMFVSNLLHI